MSLDKVIVILGGFLGIVFTYFFFLGKKEKAVKVLGEINITVSGGYSPEVISLPLGQTTKINFFRTDPAECLSEVILSDFRIKKELPLKQKVTIEITPRKAGEYNYACGMNMYHGKIIVR